MQRRGHVASCNNLKMSVGVSEALLMQKIEFLLSEIAELKKKEASLKQSNDCLLQALGNPTSPVLENQEQSFQELKKTIEIQEEELKGLKVGYKDRVVQLEKDKQELLMKIADLEFSAKQQRLVHETEKIELAQQIQKLENDKVSKESSAKGLENSKSSSQDAEVYKLEMRNKELEKEIEFNKTEARHEIVKARQEAEKSIAQIKALYEGELESVRNQLKEAQDSLRKEKARLEEFLSESDLQSWQHKVEELENELESMKNMKRLQKIEENESLFISSKEEISEIPESKSKKLSIDFEYENLIIQNERLKLYVDRAKMENNQLVDEVEKTRKELIETEENLKNEIKFLIGKLLKAKSKISIEGELSEVARRDLFMNSLRFKNIDKPLSRNSPQKYRD